MDADANKRKNKKSLLIVITVTACVVLAFFGGRAALRAYRLHKGQQLLEAGDYDAAYEILAKRHRYDLIAESQYERTIEALDEGDYDKAAELYNAMGTRGHLREEIYEQAVQYMQAGEYSKAIILLEGLEGFPYSDWEEKLNEARQCAQLGDVSSRTVEFETADVGDHVTFGSYEQDGIDSDGMEPIEWTVLAKENGRLLLISTYALCQIPYNEGYIAENSTWETCTLRAWLNDVFLDDAFTADEQEMIPVVTVTASQNPVYEKHLYRPDEVPETLVEPGNDTQDKVFILSYQEAEEYFASDNDRICEITLAGDGSVYEDDQTYPCAWWLRTPNLKKDQALVVDPSGLMQENVGRDVNWGNSTLVPDGGFVGVRPAIWVEIGN